MLLWTVDSSPWNVALDSGQQCYIHPQYVLIKRWWCSLSWCTPPRPTSGVQLGGEGIVQTPLCVSEQTMFDYEEFYDSEVLDVEQLSQSQYSTSSQFIPSGGSSDSSNEVK